jgi:hypothetical protein
MRKLLALSSVASVLLAGCGGGGEADTSTPPEGFVRIEGTLVDADGAAVAQAQTRLPSRNGVWVATSDTSGHFRLEARASDFEGVSPVMVQVVRDGYRPLPLYFSTLSTGTTYQVPTGGQQALHKLAAHQYIPKNSVGLWHIGDDGFDGSANSQLQTKSVDVGLVFSVAAWTPELRSLYKSATLEFVARGVQTVKCPGTQFGLAAGNFLSAPPIADSDPSGGFTRYRLAVDVQSVPLGADLVFFARSGRCPSDIDDLEFSDIVVSFGN